MAANIPDIQVLADNGLTAKVKITAFFTGACTANYNIVTANALSFGNTSKSSAVCTLSLSQVQYASDIAAGSVQLYWGGSTNAAIYNFATHGGHIDAYVPNNAPAPTGIIGMAITGAAAGEKGLNPEFCN